VISLIHSWDFSSASSSPLVGLLRGAPDYSSDTVSELTRRSAKETVSEGLVQGPYVAARVWFEFATFRTQGTELTTEPLCPAISTSVAATKGKEMRSIRTLRQPEYLRQGW